MIEVLGVEVSGPLLEAWAGWLAPDPQPFLIGPDDDWEDLPVIRSAITNELRDTYRLYGVVAKSRVVWLSDDGFHSLPRVRRAALVREQVARRRGAMPTVRGWSDLLDSTRLREQADGHRFVWWPSLVATNPAGILRRFVDVDRLVSRHGEVSESTWTSCDAVLPGARRLAGTFADGSVTCCFGTVMAAAGADDSQACDSVDPFEDWLSTACRKGGDSTQPGTVHVWRNTDGRPVHAAVSIGDGWMLEKQSQDWHSPLAIAAVADVIRGSRHPGERLERHQITR